jgi:hypothetical protein
MISMKGIVLIRLFVLLACTSSCSVRAEMVRSPSDEYISNLLFRYSKAKIISKDLALHVARAVVGEVYGKDELERQGEFHASDGGDTWIVEGSRRLGDYPTPENQSAPGKVRVVISKVDCQILALEQDAMIMPLDPPKR